MSSFRFSRARCLLTVIIATFSVVSASDSAKSPDEKWRQIENRLIGGLRSFLSDIAEPNDNYVETLEPCFNFVIKDSGESLKNLTYVKMFAKMAVIMDCIFVIDTLSVPYNGYQEMKSVIRKMGLKEKSIGQKVDSLVSAPVAILRSLTMIPLRTFFKLTGVFLGALMKMTSVNV